jgi:response regulator RpfG family c-di-GMP phosphodiesterase
MTASAEPVRVLFVDDERFVLDAIKRTVRKGFDASFAEGGQAALELLATEEPFAVVCTDMRMPGVDGVAVLKAFRAESPETTRILLTGQADLDVAIAAVNEGSVFRFLTKPTNPDQLVAAIGEAYELFRLRQAERVLLEQTLRGSVQALIETLSLANPLAFARTQRIRTYADRLLDQLVVPNRWEIEVAVMLSQVGAVTLPPHTSERLNSGAPMSKEEESMVNELPGLADRLLAGIPRLETVREMISSQQRWDSDEVPVGTKVLKLASDLDTLTERGLEPDVLNARLDEHSDGYGSEVFAAYKTSLSVTHSDAEIVLVPLTDLKIGMRLAGDVRLQDGVLLVGRGQVVTESLLSRIENFARTAGLAERSVAVFEAAEVTE